MATGLAALAVSLWVALSSPGSWEDDAYIFFRYARNLATGNGLAFNPGEPSFGITSVLWTLLLGGFVRIIGIEALVGAKLLCALLFSGSVWILTRLVLSRTQNPALALWASLLSVACPPLVFSAVSGMEIALNLFLLSGLAASFFMAGEKRFWAGGVWAGFLFLTRPENFLLLAVWSLLVFLETDNRGRKLIGLFLGFAAVALPWQFYFYSQTGLLLPPTRTGKLLLFIPGQYGLSLDQFHRLGFAGRAEIAAQSISVLFQFKYLLAFVPFLFLTGYYILRKRVALTRFWLAGAVYFPGLVFLFGFFFPLVKLRYFVHVYPFLIFASALGCYHLWMDVQKRWPVFVRPFWKRGGYLLLLLSVPISGYFTARKFATSSQQQDIRREIGLWLDKNTLPETRVALEPIGAIGYYSKRYTVDLGGLVQPEAWPYIQDGANSRRDSLLAYLERKKVDYLIDYRTHPWAGRVADAFPEKFDLVTRIRSSSAPPSANTYDIFRLKK